MSVPFTWLVKVDARVRVVDFCKVRATHVTSNMHPAHSLVEIHLISSLQLRWSPWGEDFVDTKSKSGGSGPYKMLNRGQIRPLHSLENGNHNGTFFCPLFLVVPSFGSTKWKTRVGSSHVAHV